MDLVSNATVVNVLKSDHELLHEVGLRFLFNFLEVHIDGLSSKYVQTEGSCDVLSAALTRETTLAGKSSDTGESAIRCVELLSRRNARELLTAGVFLSLADLLRAKSNGMHKDIFHKGTTALKKMADSASARHSYFTKLFSAAVSLLECDSLKGVAMPCITSLMRHVNEDTRGSIDLCHMLGVIVDATQRTFQQNDHANSVEQLSCLSSLLSKFIPPFRDVMIDSILVEPFMTPLAALVSSHPPATNVVLDVATHILKSCVEKQRVASHLSPPHITPVLPPSSPAGSGGPDLIEAIQRSDLTAVQEGLARGSDPNYSDGVGQTVLNWAAYTGTEEMVEAILQFGGDPNAGRNSALHYAARFGRPHICRILLRYGADPSLIDSDGLTALEVAKQAKGTSKENLHSECAAIFENSTEMASLMPSGAAEEMGECELRVPEASLSLFLHSIVPAVLKLVISTNVSVNRRRSLSLLQLVFRLVPQEQLAFLFEHSEDGNARYSFCETLCLIAASDDMAESIALILLDIATSIVKRGYRPYIVLLQRNGFDSILLKACSNYKCKSQVQSDVVVPLLEAASSAELDVASHVRDISQAILAKLSDPERLVFDSESNIMPSAAFLMMFQSLDTVLSSPADVTWREILDGNITAALVSSLSLPDGSSAIESLQCHARVEAFRRVFVPDGPSLSLMKLISLFSFIIQLNGKLPLTLFDAAGSRRGLELLRYNLRFRVEAVESETELVNLRGKVFQLEPLVTIRELGKNLSRRLHRSWYHKDSRSELPFASMQYPITFTMSTPFDTNGLFYWLGSNARGDEWVNPSRVHIVTVSSSDGLRLPYGTVDDVLSRDSVPRNCHTEDKPFSWVAVDSGVMFRPSAYCIRHATGYGESALRHWTFSVRFVDNLEC